MNNINDCIAILRDAETVSASQLIAEEDKAVLLHQLAARLIQQRFPHVAIIRAAIEQRSRQAEGQQNAPEMAPRTGEGEPPSPRKAKGKPKQAENTGSVHNRSADGGATPEAATAAEGSDEGSSS